MTILRRNKKNGFTLIETSLVLGVAMIMGFIAFSQLLKKTELDKAEMAGQQIKGLGDATNAYITNHYDTLSTLTNAQGTTTDTGPRSCSTAVSVCTITTATLVNEGLLPSSFSGKNIYGHGYNIILKRSGTAPYYKIYGMITTDNSLMVGSTIRYDLLGQAMQKAGIDSGMTRNSSSQVSGFNGSWSANSVDYSNINKLGQLAYQTGYGTYNYSVFLRRDGTLPMTGDLNMGGQNINNAKDINASGDVNATSFNGSYGRFSKNVNVSEDLSVTGFSTFGQNVNMGSQLTVKNGINSENYISAKTQNSKLQIGGGGSSDPNAVLLNVSGGAGDGYLSLGGNNNSSVKLDIWGSQRIRGDLTLSPSNDGQTLGRITTNGLNPGSYPVGWTVGLRTKDIYSSGSIGFGGDDGKLRGYMTYNKSQDKVHIFANGQLGVGAPSAAGNSGGTFSAYMNQDADGKGQIYASGNITAAGIVSGQYLRPISTVVEGTACTPNGLISKDDKGMILSCQSGLWSKSGGLSEYSAKNCPSGQMLVGYYGYAKSNVGSSGYMWLTPFDLSRDVDCSNNDNSCSEPAYIMNNVEKIKCG